LDELDPQAESSGVRARHLDLLFRYVDAGYCYSHARQGEGDLIIATSEHRDFSAGNVAEPFESDRMEGARGGCDMPFSR